MLSCEARGLMRKMRDERREPLFDWRAMTPDDSPKTPRDLTADPRVRDLATPKLKVGDQALDFELPIYDFTGGKERATGGSLRLLEVSRKQPVALIFGSYT